MDTNFFQIKEVGKEDRPLVASFISESWSSPLSVSRGRIFDTTDLPGFLYKEDGKVVGLATYHLDQEDCEIVTLNSHLNNRGLASHLIDRVIEMAKKHNCKRVWLITTNDNTHAMRFYQKRGFEWAGFHKNAMEHSRKLKPEIPQLGNDDIPIKHEIEFELGLK